MGHLTQDVVEAMPVPVPYVKVQEKIADEVAHRRDKARRLRYEASTLWDEAKHRFEEELLGPETVVEESKVRSSKEEHKQ